MQAEFADMTILMVDDTPANLTILNELLGSFKRKVATNGEKAIKIATASPHPDLILLDINMPGISGFEVCEQLKKNPETSTTTTKKNQQPLFSLNQLTDGPPLILGTGKIANLTKASVIAAMGDTVVLTTGTFLGGILHVGLQNFRYAD